MASPLIDRIKSADSAGLDFLRDELATLKIEGDRTKAWNAFLDRRNELAREHTKIMDTLKDPCSDLSKA